MSVVFWRRSVVVCGILALCSLPTVTGCAGVPIPVSTVKAYSAAKKVGDYDRARSYLSDDPRVWYETREGEGQRLSGRAMQARILAGVRIGDYCPDVRDLPEQLSRDQFQKDFGGLGGVGTRRVVEEIERRLASCAALQ